MRQPYLCLKVVQCLCSAGLHQVEKIVTVALISRGARAVHSCIIWLTMTTPLVAAERPNGCLMVMLRDETCVRNAGGWAERLHRRAA